MTEVGLTVKNDQRCMDINRNERVNICARVVTSILGLVFLDLFTFFPISLRLLRRFVPISVSLQMVCLVRVSTRLSGTALARSSRGPAIDWSVGKTFGAIFEVLSAASEPDQSPSFIC